MPSIAGFCFDYFNVVRPRVTHSPAVNGERCESYLTCLEDRAISPSVLYIQVFALQVNGYAFRFSTSNAGAGMIPIHSDMKFLSLNIEKNKRNKILQFFFYLFNVVSFTSIYLHGGTFGWLCFILHG